MWVDGWVGGRVVELVGGWRDVWVAGCWVDGWVGVGLFGTWTGWVG